MTKVRIQISPLHHTTANASTPTLTLFPSNFGCVLGNSREIADRTWTTSLPGLFFAMVSDAVDTM